MIVMFREGVARALSTSPDANTGLGFHDDGVSGQVLEEVSARPSAAPTSLATWWPSTCAVQ